MVTLKVRHLKYALAKSRGLLGAAAPFSVFFTTRFGIHTFGLRFPIDVLVLNDSNRVVRLTQGLPPGRVYFWPPVYSRIVELPAGDISRLGIRLNTTVVKLEFI